MTPPATQPKLSMAQVLICGAVIVTISMGLRHGFGLWLQPITGARGWSRETFSFALAVQNLMWGLCGPFAGAVADRFGAFRVLIAGSLLYAAGLAVMALATHGLGFLGGTGFLLGMAQAGTTYAVVYGVIGRNVDPAKRSWAMGVTAAAGSFGMFAMLPIDGALIASLGWRDALLVLACAALAIVPMAFGLREPKRVPGAVGAAPAQTTRAAIREAIGQRSFNLLVAGYFVCGFQVVFIGVHLPSYLRDKGMTPGVGITALSLVGLFNIIGSYTAGTLGARLPKRFLLSGIYGLRSVAIIAFLMAPLSPASVYAFACAIGFLWLSTVPLTNGLVADIFGVRHLGMLGGFVFLSHQVGSFLGSWLGGRLYDTYGNYDMMWGISIALGVFAAIVHLPIREQPLLRPAVA